MMNSLWTERGPGRAALLALALSCSGALALFACSSSDNCNGCCAEASCYYGSGGSTEAGADAVATGGAGGSAGAAGAAGAAP